ncbi:MAG: hypothetical protein F6K10_32485, partial [Moorea sp. SIO2B7]|nr:hypothetical protein [Moorena sp. SIO2B7]
MNSNSPRNSEFEHPPIIDTVVENGKLEEMEEAAMPYLADEQEESMPESEIVRV